MSALDDIELHWAKDAQDDGDSHQAVHRFLASASPGFSDRTLFALARTSYGTILRVRSMNEAVRGQLRADPRFSRTIRSPEVANGGSAYFMVTANAAVNRTAEGVEPCRTSNDASAWLKRKADVNGFDVVSLDVLFLPALHIERSRQGSGTNVFLNRVRFAGELKIKDESRFAGVLQCGIGRAKAFGLGLLMVL